MELLDIIDISVPISRGMTVWPGDPNTSVELVSTMKGDDDYNVSRLSLSSHCGTHIDAPWHAVSDGKRLGQINLFALNGPCYVCDLTHLERHIEAGDLERLDLPDEAERILLKTRNSAHWDRPDHPFDPAFIALTPGAAKWIVTRGIRLVGIDYLSIEPADGDGEVHRILLRAGVVPLETLDLRNPAPGPYALICLPLNIPAADGAPCRAILAATEELW